MKDRLLLFLNKEGISATSFADEIGVQRSSISHILGGRNNPSFDFILKILTKYNYLSAEWLITGRGSMYKPGINAKGRNVNDNDLFNSHISNEVNNTNSNSKINQKTEKNNKNNDDNMVTNVNKIEKIVYFYKNGTFKEYNPSE